MLLHIINWNNYTNFIFHMLPHNKSFMVLLDNISPLFVVKEDMFSLLIFQAIS